MTEVELSEAVLADHLQPIRGMALAHAIFASFEIGLFGLLQERPCTEEELASQLSLHPGRLGGLLNFLENERLVRRVAEQVTLTERCQDLLLVRPWYELLVGGYAQTFERLPTTLHAGAPYASRDGARVAIGSCGISQHDALPMVLHLLRMVDQPAALVDLGCGDGTFVAQVAAVWQSVPAFGIEPDEAARREAEAQTARLTVPNLRILPGDALNLPQEVRGLGPRVCYITAFVLQEILEQSGEPAVVELLKNTFDRDPDASWIVIEVDRRQSLVDEPSGLALGYYNPYYLLHHLTEQRLLPAADWRRIYDSAGLTVTAEILPEREYDSLGIKFGHLLRRLSGRS